MGSVGTITIAAQADVGGFIKGFGQARAVLGETKLSAKALDSSLNRMQTILRAQQATVGMSADELALYKFKMQGATEAQLAQFHAVQKATAALNRQGHALASIRGGLAGVSNAIFSIKALAVGVFAGLAGGLVVRQLGSIIAAGSDLNETLSKTDAILGDSAPAVKKFAQDMADKFGLVKQETLEVATSIGGIGKKLGGLSGKNLEGFTKRFTKLAADLSSQANISMAEAGKAITIGLVGGDSDVLKQNGAIILESTVKAYAFAHGLAKAGEALTENQKIMARSGLIAEGLASANGDLENTIGGVANASKRASGQIQNLKADVGIAFQAVTSKLLSGLNIALSELVGGFNANKDAIADWVAKAVSAGGAVDQALTKVGQAVKWTADSVVFLGANWKTHTGYIALAIAKILKPLAMLGKMIQGITNLVPGMSVSFGTTADELAKAFESYGTKNLDEGIKAFGDPISTDGITTFFDNMKKGAAVAVAAMSEAKAAAGSISTEATQKLTKGIGDLTEKLREQIATLGQSAAAADLYKLKTDGATDAQLREAKALGESLKFLQLQKSTFDHLKDEGKAVAASVLTPYEKLEKEIRKLAALQASGMITKDVADKATKTAVTGFQGTAATTNAAALDFGSKEARSAVLAFQGESRNDPLRESAKTAREQLVAQLQANGFLKMLADKFNSFADTTPQDLLGF